MKHGSAIVVGGSLTGLSLAIALAKRGIAVTVLEQTNGDERSGTGLGVERDLIARVTGTDPRSNGIVPPMPVIRTHRETSTWKAIRGWLRALADITSGIEIREAHRVTAVEQTGTSARAETPHGSFEADVVIGADGYRSVVRASVDPAHPYAPYGGFVLWRGLACESWLDPAVSNVRDLGGGRLREPDAARLVAYRVPGPDGETAAGSRQITFAWYDASRTEWLRDEGILDGDEVLSSVTLSDTMRAELIDVARSRWDAMTSSIMVSALEHDVAFGTPLTQYVPERLANGRLAIVGDAAHVASPMVGAGLQTGLLDCFTLAECLDAEGGAAGSAGERALQRYQRLRLAPDRAHVMESMDATRDLQRTSHA